MIPTATDINKQQFCQGAPVMQYPIDMIKEPGKRKDALCGLSGNNPHIFSEPRQLFCGHRVCKRCLDKAFLEQDHFNCPATAFSADGQAARCGTLINTDSAFIDVAGLREINELVVDCVFAGEGCLWQGQYGNFLSTHLDKCEVGQKRLLESKVNSLEGMLASKQVEINSLTGKNRQLEMMGKESQQTINELEEKVKLRDRRIEELTKMLADTECQSNSMEEVIRLLNDQVKKLAKPANRGEYRPSAPQSVQMAAKNPVAKVLATTEASPKNGGKIQNTQVCAAARDTGSQVFLLKDDEIFSPTFTRVARTFELDGIKAEFIFGKCSKYSPIGLFFRLHPNANAASWPCTKTITFTMSDLARGEDLSRSVHFPRAPAQCNDNPQDKPSAFVGFEEFCPEEALECSLRPKKSNFFNDEGLCQVEVAVRDTKCDEIAGPAYDLEYDSIGLHWAIRKIRSRIVNSPYMSQLCIVSPRFLTEEAGYGLSLHIDLNGSHILGKQSTSIQAVLEEDDTKPIDWPIEGVLSVRLLDRNVVTRRDVECLLQIRLDKPVVRPGFRTEKPASQECAFFKKRLLNPTTNNPDSPQYLAFDEIVVEASFLPQQ